MKKYLNPKEYKEMYGKPRTNFLSPKEYKEIYGKPKRSNFPSPMDYQKMYRGNVPPIDPHYIIDVPMAKPTRSAPLIPPHTYPSHTYLQDLNTQVSNVAFIPPIGPPAFYEASPSYSESQFVSSVPIDSPYPVIEELPAYESRSRNGSTTRPFINTRNVNALDPLLNLDDIYSANNINPYSSVLPFENVELSLNDAMINNDVERRTEFNRNRIIESPNITSMSQTPLPRSVFPRSEMHIVPETTTDYKILLNEIKMERKRLNDYERNLLTQLTNKVQSKKHKK